MGKSVSLYNQPVTVVVESDFGQFVVFQMTTLFAMHDFLSQ